MNGRLLPVDSDPIFETDRLLVPLRAILEALGATVEWSADSGGIVARRGDVVVELTVGKRLAKVGKVARELDVPARLVNNRTMVPLRFVSEAMGATVEWDPTTKTATVTLADVPGAKAPEAPSQGAFTALQVIASVSDSSPRQYSTVVVYVRVTGQDGKPVPGATVTATAHYRTTDTTHSSSTSSDGTAEIQFRISRATKGYTVRVEVSAEKDGVVGRAATGFTPR